MKVAISLSYQHRGTVPHRGKLKRPEQVVKLCTNNMATKQYFKRGNQITEVVNGRYGSYARFSPYGLGMSNYSEKRMLEDGYEIVSLTKEEATALNEAHRQEVDARNRAEYEQKMADRFDQVTTCLASAPIEIVSNEGGSRFVSAVANIKGGMEEAYHGCGKCTAYVKDGMVIAFHYGYDSPSNAPTDCNAVRCECSCYQICF